MRDRIMLMKKHLAMMTHAWHDWVPGRKFSVHAKDEIATGAVDSTESSDEDPRKIKITKRPDDPPFWDSEDSKYERTEGFVSPYDKIRK